MRRHATSPQGHTNRLDRHGEATPTEGGHTTGGGRQGHGARPPYLIGEHVRHDRYGVGRVVATCTWDDRWPCWWVPVEFDSATAGHTTRIMAKLLRPA